jgi:hypothetical protein
MSLSFPLYDTLFKKVKSNTCDISHEEKEFIVNNIASFGLSEHQFIYALIKTYQSQQSVPNSYILPFDGRQLKLGIKFKLEKFPNTLKHILLEYIHTHLKSLQEDD